MIAALVMASSAACSADLANNIEQPARAAPASTWRSFAPSGPSKSESAPVPPQLLLPSTAVLPPLTAGCTVRQPIIPRDDWRPVRIKAVDAEYIFWVDDLIGLAAYAAKKDGSGSPIRLATVSSFYQEGGGADLAIDGDWVFVSDPKYGTIQRVARDGTGLETIRFPTSAACGAPYVPRSLRAIGGFLLYSETLVSSPACTGVAPGRLMRLSEQGGAPEQLLSVPVDAFAATTSQVYATSSGELYRVDIATRDISVVTGAIPEAIALAVTPAYAIGGTVTGDLFAVELTSGSTTHTHAGSSPVWTINVVRDNVVYEAGPIFEADETSSVVKPVTPPTYLPIDGSFAIDGSGLYVNGAGGIDRFCP